MGVRARSSLVALQPQGVFLHGVLVTWVHDDLLGTTGRKVYAAIDSFGLDIYDYHAAAVPPILHVEHRPGHLTGLPSGNSSLSNPQIHAMLIPFCLPDT
jgi:hypothetical protein